MTNEEFRARFNADRRADQLTWVFGNNSQGIALGLNGGNIVCKDHRGQFEMPLEAARFVTDRKPAPE